MIESDTTAVDGEIKRNIAMRVAVLARMMRNRFDREVSSLGVTRSKWSMIAVVSRNPGATQRVIADALEMSEASTGRLIDKLCSEGLLERQERYDDRRARAVYLTKAAEPLLAKLGEIAVGGEKSVFRGFSDEELTTLKGYLDRLYKNVG
jgi:MarR family transcriptional regulator, transcriptional regulator for hemolysin